MTLTFFSDEKTEAMAPAAAAATDDKYRSAADDSHLSIGCAGLLAEKDCPSPIDNVHHLAMIRSAAPLFNKQQY
jgi:hypothetical protein